LDNYQFAYMFNRISSPIVELLKDASGLAALYVILSSLFPRWAENLDLPTVDAYADDDDGLLQYLEGVSLAAGLTGAAGGFIRGGPFGAVIFGLLGLFGGEAIDDVVAAATEGELTPSGQEINVGFTLLMIKLRAIYQGVKGGL
jgi:hypothetical protein